MDERNEEVFQAQNQMEDSTYVALQNWQQEIEENMQRILQSTKSFNPQSDLYKNFVAELLGRIDPKEPFGTALHNAVGRLSWNMFFEAMAITRRGKKLEVYLRKRDDDDSNYPGEWNAPGSAFRPGEKERDVANRLEQEFGTPISSFQYVGEYVDWVKGEARGSGVSRIYLVKLGGAPREDERHGWFPVNQLPEVMASSHPIMIPMAIRAHSRRTR